jgi:hypothetical protein
MERVSPTRRLSPKRPNSEASQLPRRCDASRKFSMETPLGPLHVWVDDTETAHYETGYDPGESHFFKHGM